MKEITFEYRDAYSHGAWRKQKCRVRSVSECIKIYGLNESDVEYRIVEVKDID